MIDGLSVAASAPQKDYRVPPQQFVEEQTLQQPSKQQTPREYSRDFSSDLAAVGFSEPGSIENFEKVNSVFQVNQAVQEQQQQQNEDDCPLKIFQCDPRVYYF